MAGDETEIVVAFVGLASGMVLEWVRARGARSVATMQVADSRERRLQEASDALIDDYRERLADALAEVERLGGELRRLERQRRHFHHREPKGAR